MSVATCNVRYQDDSQNGEMSTCGEPAVVAQLCEHHLHQRRLWLARQITKKQSEVDAHIVELGQLVVAPGCPRHPVVADRRCTDARCQATWDVPGAPTPEEQLAKWASGESVCPNTKHECCPDFSCCKPNLRWPVEKRVAYVASEQKDRERMCVGALVGLVDHAKLKAHVVGTLDEPPFIKPPDDQETRPMTDDQFRRVLNKLRVERASLTSMHKSMHNITDDHIERLIGAAQIETLTTILDAFDSEVPHEVCKVCDDLGPHYGHCSACGKTA